VVTAVAGACPVFTTVYPVRLKFGAVVVPLGWVAVEVPLPKGAERLVPALPGGGNAGFACPDPAALVPKFN